jgi:hypothetical protein
MTKLGFEKRHENVTWYAQATREAWSPDQVAIVRATVGHEPNTDELHAFYDPDTLVVEGNALLSTGVTRIMSLLNGAGGQAATNTATRIGTGDGSTAVSVGDTDLSAASGSTHRWFQVVDATYPSVAGGVLTVKATYASGDGNYTWSEWCVDVGTPTVTSGATANTLLNRKIATLGVKSPGAVWALTVTLTLS